MLFRNMSYVIKIHEIEKHTYHIVSNNRRTHWILKSVEEDSYKQNHFYINSVIKK